MMKRLFPLLILGVLTLNGASGIRLAHHSGTLPAANKTSGTPAPPYVTRKRSPKRYLRRFISSMTRKHSHK